MTSLARGTSPEARQLGIRAGIPLESGAALRLHGRYGERQAALDDEDLATLFASEESRIVVVAEVFDPGVAAIAWAVDVYEHGGGAGKKRPPVALRHVRNIGRRT